MGKWEMEKLRGKEKGIIKKRKVGEKGKRKRKERKTT
jgi:hypothetical protein